MSEQNIQRRIDETLGNRLPQEIERYIDDVSTIKAEIGRIISSHEEVENRRFDDLQKSIDLLSDTIRSMHKGIFGNGNIHGSIVGSVSAIEGRVATIETLMDRSQESKLSQDVGRLESRVSVMETHQTRTWQLMIIVVPVMITLFGYGIGRLLHSTFVYEATKIHNQIDSFHKEKPSIAGESND